MTGDHDIIRSLASMYSVKNANQEDKILQHSAKVIRHLAKLREEDSRLDPMFRMMAEGSASWV
jgi:hypothetical protein